MSKGNYNVFAEYYDRIVGERRQDIQKVIDTLAELKPRPQSVLELGCGTGTVLKALAPHFQIEGLDLSKEMLDRAREKLPKVCLTQANMSNFSLGRRFDAVVCVFDSLNHLPSWAGWLGAFNSICKHLTEEGIFLFDIHTAFGLERAAARTPWLKRLGEAGHAIIDVQYPRRYQSIWSVELYLKHRGNQYRLHQEDVREVAFSTSRITEALRKRFRKVNILEGMRPARAERLEKIHFLCRHPLGKHL